MQLPNIQVFDATAAGWAASVDQSIQKGRYLRGELFVSAAVDHIESGSLILDYGCGPGRISLMLARRGFRVLGLDSSPAMISVAKQQPLGTLDVEFRVCPERPSDPPEARYAAIVCSSVIQYIPQPEQLLQWFSIALCPSGILIISFDNSHSLWGTWCRFRHTSAFCPAQRYIWSWPQFRRLLVRCGFAPAGDAIYFESPLDRVRFSRSVRWSPLFGTLGLVVARRSELLY